MQVPRRLKWRLLSEYTSASVSVHASSLPVAILNKNFACVLHQAIGELPFPGSCFACVLHQAIGEIPFAGSCFACVLHQELPFAGSCFACVLHQPIAELPFAGSCFACVLHQASWGSNYHLQGLVSRLNIGGLQFRSFCLVSLFSGVVDVVVVVVVLVVVVIVVVVVVVVVGVVLVAAAVSLIWRFRFLIYLKHAPSFGAVHHMS